MRAVARRGLLIGLVLLLTAPPGLALAGAAVVRASDAGLAEPGQPAPQVSLPSLRSEAGQVHLADLRGKVVYLDFWSSWCAPCRRSMPRLDALRRAFSREDFEVIGVNVDVLADDARRFLEQVPVSYPTVSDPGGRVAARFGVEALPALVVVDGAGVVREALTGRAVENRDALEALASALLKEAEQREVQ